MLDKYIYSLKQYLVLPSEQKQCISLLFQTIENEIQSRKLRSIFTTEGRIKNYEDINNSNDKCLSNFYYVQIIKKLFLIVVDTKCYISF